MDPAKKCNLEDNNLAAVVTDYVSPCDSAASCDDGGIGKLFVDLSTAVSPVTGTRTSPKARLFLNSNISERLLVHIIHII